MKSRYELTISANYVPGWTYIEAVRELFQNALDNEIENTSNKMEFSYDEVEEVLRISNKTSVLQVDSLLLGNTTKADNEDTIGQHGEGYKVGFVVLLREGKKVKVYNYGNREIWTTKLVKSRRYNGALVPVIIVEKEAFWKQVPDNDLVIEISGINPEEYEAIVTKNLNLQEDVESYDAKDMGKILINKKEKGNIYVSGLFISNIPELEYGYSFIPRIVRLDRDRRLVNTLDVSWETSLMWKKAFADDFMKDKILDMVSGSKVDTGYIKSRVLWEKESVDLKIANSLATRFIDSYGERSVPVENNDELSRVRDSSSKPVMVNRIVKQYIAIADKVEVEKVPDEASIKEEFQSLLDSIQHKLEDDEVDKFMELIDKL